MERELIHYIKENRQHLTEELIGIYKSSSRTGLDITIEQYSQIACRMIDVFCETLENNNFQQFERFTENLVESKNGDEISISDAQFIIFSVRNSLLTNLGHNCHSEDPIRVFFQVNQVFDKSISHLWGYSQRKQAQNCSNYAARLEKKIQKRTCELEESKSNYQILFEKINDGCFVNQNGRIVFANKTFCEMHAYERSEMIGMECQKLISEDSREMVMQRFYQHLKGKNRFDTFIYCRQDKNGRRIPTENRIKLIKYQGRPAVLGLSTDITERIEMEEKIKQKDRLALIGRLTTSIAHEIRNPLSAIKVNIELLLENLNLDGNDLRRLQIAQEQSTLLENILSEILKFAKPIKLDYSMTDVGKLIEYTMDLFEEKINRKNIRIRRSMDADVDYIMADRARIIEAVANVFKNAIEAFDNDDPKEKFIEISTQNLMVDSKQHLRLSIMDNGKGIKAKDRKKMFEPFVTIGKKGGVGLGLPIVRRIIDAHNGYFDIKSEVGEGTSFSFIIPTEITH
jgi:PAS domain S-box-containing protein